MDPHDIHSLVDPFGGQGIPGDPMEQVLSLQAYDSAAAPVPCSRTCACNTGGCTTNSCTFSCAAQLADGTELEELYTW